MALHNDIDPLPVDDSAVKKIKNLTFPIKKIKPIVEISRFKLANAIFLLGGKTKLATESVGHSSSEMTRLVLRTCGKAKPLLPHISIFTVAVIVILSNLIVKYARADYSLSFPEPANEIALAATVDPYTPLIQTDGAAAESAYQSSGGPFIAVNTNVDTAITEREAPLPDNSSATINYVVQQGDNLTTLGWKFEVKLATLMYLNDIDNANLVKPGQTLKVPPRGYEVSASLIAKKQKEKELASAKRNTTIRNSSSSRTAAASVRSTPGSSKNGYPYGYCTYYVATKRYVPSNWGNAKNWLYSAQRAGYATGGTPAVGSIGVTPESWWGHVVYVESVNGNSVTFSEMNAIGWGKKSTRTLPVSAFRGFIY